MPEAVLVFLPPAPDMGDMSNDLRDFLFDLIDGL